MATAPAQIESARPAIGWEEPACLLCGCTRRDTVLEAPDSFGEHLWFAVVRCRDCGLHYTSPRPDEFSIAGFYPADYGPHRPKSGRSNKTVAPLAWLRGRPCPERRSLPPHGQGRLLDFGCGNGDFLERMRDQGWQVTGIDISPSAVASARSRLGLRVLAGTLPHPKLAAASFDVITMWQVLEHVHAPLEALRAARELLAPGGRLYVAVPNIASWPFHWFGPAWFGLELPRHLTHFSPDTLLAMLNAAGFPHARIRYVRHSDWLRMSAERSTAGRHAPGWHRWLRHKTIARPIAWASYAVGRSDCILATTQID